MLVSPSIATYQHILEPRDHGDKQGGYSHRRRFQSYDCSQDAVKGTRHFLRVSQMVKQCSRADVQYNGNKVGVATKIFTCAS